jgi:signal recognition particle subunit SEC65
MTMTNDNRWTKWQHEIHYILHEPNDNMRYTISSTNQMTTWDTLYPPRTKWQHEIHYILHEPNVYPPRTKWQHEIHYILHEPNDNMRYTISSTNHMTTWDTLYPPRTKWQHEVHYILHEPNDNMRYTISSTFVK